MQQSTIKPETKEPLKPISIGELQEKLKTSPDGLSQNETQDRLKQYGYNEIPEEKINPFLKFLTYFWGPIPWMNEVFETLALNHLPALSSCPP
jgi:H+-transporting ATPase